MHTKIRPPVLVAALAAVALAASAAAQSDVPTLAFTVSASGIEAPDSLEAGFYRVVAEAEGEMSPEVQILRLQEGVSVDEVVAAFDAMVGAAGPEAGAATAAVVDLVEAGVGGVGFPPAIVRLEPGEYFATVWGPEEGGPSYVSQGVYTTFTVTEGGAGAEAPTADLTVDMMDFAFSIPDEVAAGAQTWEIQNVGEQIHHMILFRVEEGKTLEDVMGFLQSEGPPSGPPPFTSAGAVNVLSPGQRNFVTFDFAPGSYVALCFIPDYETGVPHVALGMIDAFTVLE